MTESEDTSVERKERSDQEVSSTPEPKYRRWICVDIKLADNHYVAAFNHGAPRIFHNMQQLLTAIEVESAKLGPGPTQT